MADRLLDSKEEGLIPGLPDDVSMQCLARISHGYEGMAQCVSRRWRDVFRSEEIGQMRAQGGLSGDWIFVYAQEKLVAGWQAYDPAADRWHYLPPAPGFSPHSRHLDFSCVVLNRRLLVLGGLRRPISKMEDLHSDHSSEEGPSNRVLCFDPFFRKWIELPGMMSPRSRFCCVVLNGRVLVAGGGTISAESFDPKTNTWEALPVIPEPIYECRATPSGGHFQLVGFTAVGSRRHFILCKDEWKVVTQKDKQLCLHEIMVMVTDGRLFLLLLQKMVMFDAPKERRIYGRPYYFAVPTRFMEWSFGFVGLRGRPYLVGGLELDPRDRLFRDSATVRYFDPSASTPSHWHLARPLLGGGGYILGCATLQQE